MSYINTIDINGEVYNLGNLTDGDHVVDLPALSNDDIFLLRGDVINNLTSSDQNKPLSANQGRIIDNKITDLTGNLSDLKQQSETKDSEIEGAINTLRTDLDNKGTELDGKITKLNTDMQTNDAETLSSAKLYADGLKDQSDNKVTDLDNKITQLRSDMETGDATTLSSAKKYTDDNCATINNTITSLEARVDDNRATFDSNIIDLRAYVDNTFVEKSKITDDLITDSNTQVLSAKQGKILNDKKLDISGGTMSGNIDMNHNGINNIYYANIIPWDQTEGVAIQASGIYSNPVLEISGTHGDEETIIRGIALPVAANDAATKDYVDSAVSNCVSNFVDGAWTYIKMENGVAIAWCTTSQSAELKAAQDADISISATYPSGLFVSTPICLSDILVSGYPVIKYMKAVGSNTSTPEFGIHCLNTSDITATVYSHYLAIGKWK